ncbi:hypothetical protein SISSUDRAFT_5 [Sistotremastrum suecicum HHB10207 ss-3]|uniref:REJ domain-containing protein n=1 Tax=Sistotremastrum suecicum HHB10207 ss-3 TaxID=1314776 RepID=A0A166J155_9AGAM|nr:hypothetical protein SISSUDRAFT_5 [Sistotremastrum suecicum HHB10207 ss-3]
MAGQQPTQPLPSWLSFSSFTTVDASGAPTTEATIVTLPLTYFGPSIPLGTNGVWVFGGSTSPPPSTSTSPTTTSLISSTSSTPTPTPTSSSITQSNTSVESSTTAATTTSESSATATNTSTGSVISSSSSTTSPSTSSSPSSSLSSSSSTTNALSTTSSSSSSNTAGSSTPSGTSTSSQGTPTSPTSHLKSLHTGAIVGIVVGSVVALLLLLLLFFCCWRHRRRLRMLRRRSGWSGFDEVPAAELAGATAPGMGEHERDTLMVSEGDEAGPSTGPAVAFSSEPAPVPEGPRHITEHQFDDPRPSSDHGGVEGVGIALAGPDGDEETSSRSSTLSALIRQERARSTNPQELARSLFWSPSQPSVTRAPLRQSELLRLPDTHDELGLPRDGPSPSLIALSPPPRRSSSQNSPTNNSPLQPPRTLNPDMIPTASSRASGSRSRHSATPSMAYPDSPISETDEGAAFLTARRVRVEQPSAWFMQSLNRLSNRLSWFNRTSEAERSPPASRPASRPTSAAFGRLTDDEIAAGRAMMQVSRDQLLLTRPVSGVSAASSRGTVYHDAPSRPGSVSEPPLSARTFGRPPSEYNVPTSDVLDMPAPPPASTLSSTRSSRNPIFPPGLSSIPNPAVFQSTSSTSAEGSQSVPRSPIVSMASDGLEDEPPRAGEQWTHLQGSTRGGGLHPGGSSSRLDLGHDAGSGSASTRRDVV